MFTLIIVLILSSIYCPINFVNASGSHNPYAQITKEDVFLYKNPINSTEYVNVYFLIEPSYCVELLQDYNQTFYKAKYMDKIGYVKKEEVQCISNSPNKPFLDNVSFRIYSSNSTSVYSLPCTSSISSKKAVLPQYFESCIYYGKINGEEMIKDRTKVWFYVKYDVENNLCGYIYTEDCDKINNMVKNQDEYNYISEPVWPTENSNQLSINIDSNSSSVKILILLISIPTLLSVIMFFKGLSKKNRQENSEIKEFTDN